MRRINALVAAGRVSQFSTDTRDAQHTFEGIPYHGIDDRLVEFRLREEVLGNGNPSKVHAPFMWQHGAVLSEKENTEEPQLVIGPIFASRK